MPAAEPSIRVRKYRKDHPWIFSNEIIRQKKDIPPGAIVDVYKGRDFIGRGFYNPHSLIALRCYTTARKDFDRVFIREKIDQAIAYRASRLNERSYRAVFSESDGLPGLIVDRYENVYVLQVNSYGVHNRLDDVIDVLAEFKPACIYERSEGRARTMEGLLPSSGARFGALPPGTSIEQDGVRFIIDIAHGQKTGFFFDLRDARRLVMKMARGKRVLDLFCYTGAFSLYAARGGAQAVDGVDVSPAAIDSAHENARLNDISCTTFHCADAFAFLRGEQTRYDLIILDPPSFARTKKEVKDALRGYKELHVQAFRLLAPQGILVTTCCSFHVGDDDFCATVRAAARDVQRTVRITGHLQQAADHPVLLSIPESHYLKGLILKAVA